MVSKGTLELRQKLAAEGRGSKSKLAEKLGVPLAMVSKWLSGDVGPDTKNRAGIEDALQISWRLWDEPAETPDSEEPAAGDAA